jgi:hypothetical protein
LTKQLVEAKQETSIQLFEQMDKIKHLSEKNKELEGGYKDSKIQKIFGKEISKNNI